MKKVFVPLIVVFGIVNMIAIVFRTRLEEKQVDTTVIILANLILFSVSLLSVWMYSRPSDPKRPHAVVNNVYGGILLKFFVIIVSVIVYFFFATKINKPAVLISMGLYLVYNLLGAALAVKKKTIPKVDHPAHPGHPAHSAHPTHKPKH